MAREQATPWRIRFMLQGELEIRPPIPYTTGGSIMFSTPKEGPFMAEITVPDDQAGLVAHAHFMDAEGNPAPPDTTPVWTVGDETVLKIGRAHV